MLSLRVRQVLTGALFDTALGYRCCVYGLRLKAHVYEYAAENGDTVDRGQANERNEHWKPRLGSFRLPGRLALRWSASHDRASRVRRGPVGQGTADRSGLTDWATSWGVVGANFSSHEPLRGSIRSCRDLVAGAPAYRWKRHIIRCRWLFLPHLSHVPFRTKSRFCRSGQPSCIAG
jgi:hypothetical protein